MANEDRIAEARRKAKLKYDFYVHLCVYLLIIGVLFIVNLLTSAGYLWFIWPAIGWGVAVLLHGLSAFFISQKQNGIIDTLTRRELAKQHKEHHRRG